MTSPSPQTTTFPCVVSSVSSQDIRIWNPLIYGRARNGCAPWSSCRTTGAVSGNRLDITIARTFGARNDSGKYECQNNLATNYTDYTDLQQKTGSGTARTGLFLKNSCQFV